MTFQNFIVLGLIPGTHVQITFQLWSQVMAMLITIFAGIYVLRHHKRLTILILGLYVRHAVKGQQLVGSNWALLS